MKVQTGDLFRSTTTMLQIEIIQVLELKLNGKLVKHYLAVNQAMQYNPESLWVLRDEDMHRWTKLVNENQTITNVERTNK